jgi:ribosomal protein L39E
MHANVIVPIFVMVKHLAIFDSGQARRRWIITRPLSTE